MDLELENRVVVVTGASRGIGLACAVALAQEGAKVIGISRDVAHLRAAHEHLAALGLSMFTQAADLKDSVAAQAVMERVENEHGPIEALINCAGAARRTPPEQLDSAALQAAMQSKYLTYMHAIDPVIRRMAARGSGSIVNVIGQGGRQASAQHIAGGSANAALMLATVGYATAYAARGVRINAINPGMTRTGRVDDALAMAMHSSGRTREAVLAERLADIPIGRMAEPEEIANVAIFLVSAKASYVTGAIISMDGGKASTV